MTSTQSVFLSYCRQQQMLMLRTKSGSRHCFVVLKFLADVWVVHGNSLRTFLTGDKHLLKHVLEVISIVALLLPIKLRGEFLLPLCGLGTRPPQLLTQMWTQS